MNNKQIPLQRCKVTIELPKCKRDRYYREWSYRQFTLISMVSEMLFFDKSGHFDLIICQFYGRWIGRWSSRPAMRRVPLICTLLCFPCMLELPADLTGYFPSACRLMPVQFVMTPWTVLWEIYRSQVVFIKMFLHKRFLKRKPRMGRENCRSPVFVSRTLVTWLFSASIFSSDVLGGNEMNPFWYSISVRRYMC